MTTQKRHKDRGTLTAVAELTPAQRKQLEDKAIALGLTRMQHGMVRGNINGLIQRLADADFDTVLTDHGNLIVNQPVLSKNNDAVKSTARAIDKAIAQTDEFAVARPRNGKRDVVLYSRTSEDRVVPGASSVRTCSRCGVPKPLTREYFAFNGRGFMPYCTRCHREQLAGARYRRMVALGKVPAPTPLPAIPVTTTPQPGQTPLFACHKCHVAKPRTREYFHYNVGNKDGLAYLCRECKAKYNETYNHGAPKQRPPVNTTSAVCKTCGVEKPLTTAYFQKYKDSRTLTGYAGSCRACESARRKAWYQARKQARMGAATIVVDTDTTPAAPLRECRNCHTLKPQTTEFFSPNKGGRGGLHTYCRVCQNAIKLDSSIIKHGTVKHPRNVAPSKRIDDTPDDFGADGVEWRTCTKCHVAKPLNREYYHASGSHSGGFTRTCKVCRNNEIRAARARARSRGEGRSAPTVVTDYATTAKPNVLKRLLNRVLYPRLRGK